MSTYPMWFWWTLSAAVVIGTLFGWRVRRSSPATRHSVSMFFLGVATFGLFQLAARYFAGFVSWG